MRLLTLFIGALISVTTHADVTSELRSLLPVSAGVTQARGHVIFLASKDCPVARSHWAAIQSLASQYRAKGIEFHVVSANPGEKFFESSLPASVDPEQRIAKALGATIKGETFLLDSEYRQYYRGPVDSQFTFTEVTGVQRKASAPPEGRYLENAIADLLAGKTVASKPQVLAKGCAITIREPRKGGDLTYWRDIKPLMEKHCLDCHLEGRVAGHVLDVSTYDGLLHQLETIRRHVRSRTMPPWFAEKGVGEWMNERRMADSEIDTIVEWVRAGAPEGKPTPETMVLDGKSYDTVDTYYRALDSWAESKKKQYWDFGSPDAVFSMRESYPVPASGTVDYVYLEQEKLGRVENFDAPKKEWRFSDISHDRDRWVTKSQIISSLPSTVHHVIAYVLPPPGDIRAKENESFIEPLISGSVLQRMMTFQRFGIVDPKTLAWGDRIYGVGGNKPSWEIGRFVPGDASMSFQKGYGAKIPKEGRLLFELHYTPDGEAHPGGDQTYIGVKWTEVPPAKEVVTLPLGMILGVNVPAKTKNHPLSREFQFPRDVELVSFRPHAHLLGKRFLYELVREDGSTETLLSVPNYSFAQQPNYYMKSPRKVKAGTVIRLTGWYDNDTDKPVYFGQQTNQEMFFGYVTVAEERR